MFPEGGGATHTLLSKSSRGSPLIMTCVISINSLRTFLSQFTQDHKYTNKERFAKYELSRANEKCMM